LTFLLFFVTFGVNKLFINSEYGITIVLSLLLTFILYIYVSPTFIQGTWYLNLYYRNSLQHYSWGVLFY